MNNFKDTEQFIRSLKDQRYDAIIKGDFQIFADLAHPDLSYAHSNGVVDTVESHCQRYQRHLRACAPL
jgi:hypothetical protein